MAGLIIGDKNYKSAAIFYKMLGFNANSPIYREQFFSWLVFGLFLILVLYIAKESSLNLIQITFLSFFALMFGIYFAYISKDLIIFLFMTLGTYLVAKYRSILPLSIVIIVYATLFRSYWFLVLITFLLLYYAVQKNKSVVSVAIFSLLAIVIIVFAYNIINGSQMSVARTAVNDQRLNGQQANTMINNLLPNSSVFTDTINCLYVFLSLFLPIDGLGSFNEIIYYFWIWGVTVSMLLKWKKIKRNHERQQYLYLSSSFCLLLALVVIQSMFEPDIGSVFRHQLAIVPILILLLFQNSDAVSNGTDITKTRINETP